MTRRRKPFPDPVPPLPPDDSAPTPLPPTDHVSRAIHLLTWARTNGYRVGPHIVVGDVTLQVDDIRQAKRELDRSTVVDRGVYAGTGAEDEPEEGT